MNAMKILGSIFFLFLLSSCTQLQAPVGNWIDVPLSENTFSENVASYRTGSYDIPLAGKQALEYKLGLLEGDSIVYTWTVEMIDSSLLNVEFHGHTERLDDEPGKVMFYKIHQEGRGEGSLISPFNGIHGWYFNNQSDEDIVVHMNVSGFYTELEN